MGGKAGGGHYETNSYIFADCAGWQAGIQGANRSACSAVSICGFYYRYGSGHAWSRP